jgi:AcrR family transcriptional regulator
MNSNNRFRTGSHDARWQKSHTALKRAVLELAAEQDIEAMTAHEVATRAGVNRSTFYKHATTPADFLRSILREDLEIIRENMLVEMQAGPPRAAIKRALNNLLAHVLEHKDIYGPALGATDDAALHQLLSGHLEETFMLVFTRGYVTLPFADDEAATGARFAARFISHGTVGAIDAWLADSEVLDIGEFLTRFVYQLPAWWPEGEESEPSADGA